MEFWKSFMDSCSINNRNSVTESEKEFNETKSKRQLYWRLVDDNTFLHLKCSNQELNEELEREEAEYNETMRILEQKYRDMMDGKTGVLECSCNCNDEQFFTRNYNSIVLTNDVQIRKQIKKRGILAVSLKDIVDSRYNQEKPIGIPQDQRSNWKDYLITVRHPCNSLLIIDSYIRNNLEENLFTIIDTLIPKDIEVEFQLTIVTSEDQSFKMGDQLKRIYKSIKNHLSTCGNNTRVNLSLVRVNTGQQHDRKILSNTVLIECAGGFDLFKRGKATKQTTVHYSFPKFADPKELDTYYSAIKQARDNTNANFIITDNGEDQEAIVKGNRIFSQLE